MADAGMQAARATSKGTVATFCLVSSTMLIASVAWAETMPANLPLLQRKMGEPLFPRLAQMVLNRGLAHRLSNKLGDRLSNRLGDKLSNRLRDRLSNVLGDKLSNRLRDKLSNRLGDKLSNKLRDKLSNRLRDRLSNRLGDMSLQCRGYLSEYGPNRRVHCELHLKRGLTGNLQRCRIELE